MALATILAATIGYENAMTARRGTATFAFEQSLEVAKAAEAIAAYALRAMRQTNHTTTYPAQPWSTPYGPVDLVPGVTLEAWLEDAQGRFNLNNLVKTDGTGATDDDAVAVLQNLLTERGPGAEVGAVDGRLDGFGHRTQQSRWCRGQRLPVSDAALSCGQHADHQRQRDSGAARISVGIAI